jgi:integrase
LEILKQLVAFFGDDLLTAIDRDRVKAYHTVRRTDTPPAAAVTINREVDLLKGMLRDAVPKYLSASPLVGMPRLRIVPPRRRYVSAAEFDRLLAVCADPQDTAILVLGRDGLARLGDLLDLQHADRDPEQPRLVHVRDPKGGDPYELVLTDRALKAVDALATDTPYLFPKFRKALEPRDWTGSVRQRLEYLCRQARIPYGRTKHGVTFHWGTRRSGATDLLVKDKQPLPIVQQQGNWKKPNVLLEIYSEVSREDMLAALAGQPAQKAKRKRA